MSPLSGVVFLLSVFSVTFYVDLLHFLDFNSTIPVDDPTGGGNDAS